MELPTYEEIFRQIKINFRLSGMPFDEPPSKVRFFALVSALTLVLTEEIAYFVANISGENFLNLTQLAPCIAIGALSLIKILLIFFKRSKVFVLTRRLAPLYEDIRRDVAQAARVKSDVILLKTLIKYYFILNAVLISIYNFSTLVLISYQFLERRELRLSLPYLVLVPLDVEKWYNWLLVYVQLVICGFICVLYFTTVDALYFVLTSQVCTNLSVLSDQLERLQPHSEEPRDILKLIVNKHQYILNLSEELEDIFTGPNFFNVLVGSLLICALGFNLTTGEWAQLPGVVLFLSSVLLQILMMSIFGEKLIQEIISTSWSYFTILKTVYKPSPRSQDFTF